LFAVLALTLVTGTACGGGSDENARKAIERLIEISQKPGTTTKVTFGGMPEGLPDGIPMYPGSTLMASTVTTGGVQTGYGLLRDTGDPLDKVFQYYEQGLGTDPWLITLSGSQRDVAEIQFTSVNDSSLAGAVVIQPTASIEGHLSIFLSVETNSTEATSTQKPFQLGPSKPLPPGFPPQASIYPDATITDTAWARSTSSLQWQVTFLVQKSPQDVIDYYRTELRSKGLTVTDQPAQGQTLILSMDNVSAQPPWSGTIAVGLLQNDPSYTQTTLEVVIGSQPTPAAAATTTP
jgi:hypothetical protein